MFHYGFAVARSILRNQDNLVLRQPEPLTVVLFAHASVMFSLQDYFNNYTRVSEGKKKKKKGKVHHLFKCAVVRCWGRSYFLMSCHPSPFSQQAG